MSSKIVISGFDPAGEPEITVGANRTKVMFNFMPPSYVSDQAHADAARYDSFEIYLQCAVHAKVTRDDRELFYVHSVSPAVIRKLVDYLSGYAAGAHRRWIEIVSRPPGDAPEEIRDKWVGIVLELSERVWVQPRTPANLPQSAKPLEYVVERDHAMARLAVKHPGAVEFWREKFPPETGKIGFWAYDAACCREVLSPPPDVD